MKNQRKIYSAIEEKIGRELEFPIPDLKAFVKDIGGDVVETPERMLCAEGLVRGVENKPGTEFEILIAPDLSIERQRFTIAHELGHLFLHMGYLHNKELWDQQKNKSYAKSEAPGNREEKEADEFAFEFLMPAESFEKELMAASEDNRVNISSVAKVFQVTNDVAKERGRMLELVM